MIGLNGDMKRESNLAKEATRVKNRAATELFMVLYLDTYHLLKHKAFRGMV